MLTKCFAKITITKNKLKLCISIFLITKMTKTHKIVKLKTELLKNAYSKYE